MDFRQQILFLIILITLFVLHDLVQGYVAEKEGDSTPRLMGRLTANPIPHLDLFTSIILPGLLLLLSSPFILGWPKPMPFNPFNFKNQRKGFRNIGIAGLLVYFLLLAGSGISFSLLSRFGAPEVVFPAFVAVMQISASLLILQLLPLPFFDMFYLISGLRLGTAVQNYILWAERNAFWISILLLFILLQVPFFEFGVRFLTNIFIF